MRVAWGAWKACVIVAGCLLLTLPVLRAQNSNSGSADAAREILVQKARALDARGRPDMAIQLWQQILLSAPQNTEALAGLARDYKLIGATSQANATLDRLRKVNPNDPEIARIENLSSTATQSSQLRQAGELARQGRNDDAMRIYRQLYGDQPPNGDIALAYYQTLYGTANGKQAAIAGMRTLVARNPGDPRYFIQLGILLTYDPRTRAEGIRILQSHPSDSAAQAALRQALVWDSANPASASELREYLKAHPQDTELVDRLKLNEAKLAEINSGIARTPAERAAFAALNAHRAGDAERRFTALLAQDPKNTRALAGMGFLRMQQKKFGDAISYLTQAEQNGYKPKIIDDALSASRFYDTLAQAAQAMDRNQFDVAAAGFHAALDMRPGSADALNGLAGLYLKQKQYASAASTYEQLIKIDPRSFDGWRGLFLADANAGQNDAALAVVARAPAPIHSALNRDPDYLRSLAAIYQAQGRAADAERVLALALQLPFPGNGATLQTGTRMQYAGILMEAKRFDQAAALYAQVVQSDSANVSAWMGLVSAHHEQGLEAEALSDVQRMPPDTYQNALGDAGFLAELAAIYQDANQYDVAQGMLERAVNLDNAAGKQPGIDLELQLAGIYLLRNNTQQAYGIFRQVLTSHPDNAGAWKGLISALAATNRNADALQELAEMPATVRTQLDSQIDFVQIEANLYAATGNSAGALQYMNRVQAYYAKRKALPPPNIDIQNAWLLYNLGDDRALYASLMRIGGRTDLSLEQRETVQNIWANWSVRRAAAAMDNGNAGRAVDILDAAALAFPNNLTVRKAVAGGYERVGRAKEALALYQDIPMQDATAGDFEGAIGAALAANDRNQAEVWLRQALARYPRDPAVLNLAARYEQARGENQLAADYYRAAIAAMPSVTPADRLAHQLVYPEQDQKTHRAVTAADLQHLLDPDYEPFAKTTRLPPLPAYGPDPYDGGVPVILPQSAPAPQLPPVSNPAPPASHDLPPPPVPHAALHPFVRSSSPPHFALASWTFSRPGFRTSSDLLHAPVSLLQSAAQPYSDVDLTLNPPHSLASDAWKGLVFSLMAGNRNAEALAQLSRIPPEVRRQLEADIEWAQGLANLYYSVGDAPEANDYLKRVESFYLLHPGVVPAGIDLQHAWLLYSVQNDTALYPVLTRIDARTDLTPQQRQRVQMLWADWALRRANQYIAGGQLPRALQILQAALQDYPDNLNLRLAVAGMYMRIGYAPESLAVYKSTSMANAVSADYQGAIGAAMAAQDMAQAEIWLRVALSRFPGDPQILTLAGQFEQARGNSKRAKEFFRAALAAAPQGSTSVSLATGISSGSANNPAPTSGQSKRLLDPRLNPQAAPQDLAPLPSFKSAPQATAAAPPPYLPSSAPPSPISAPSSNPLPLPANFSGSGDEFAGQGSSASSSSSTTPATNFAPEGPVFVEQNKTQQAVMQPASNRQPSGELPPPLQLGGTAGASSQQNVNPAGNPEPESANLVHPALPDQSATATAAPSHSPSSEPQNQPPPMRNLPAAPIASPPASQPPPYAAPGADEMAQYTPSVQDAVSGAFSAPQQLPPPAASQQPPAAAQPPACTPATPPACAPAKPHPAHAAAPHKKPLAKTNAQSAQPPEQPSAGQTTQTLGNAPIASVPAESVASPSAQGTEAQAPAESPQQNSTETTGAGLSDQELQQQNLPPLRGPWIRIRRQPNLPSPREEAEQQLAAIESSYSGWFGFSSLINHRSGSPGYSQLTAIEPPFEASAPLGYRARITAIAKPAFLDSGQADGSANLAVKESESGATCLVTIPEPIGTYTASQSFSPCSSPTIGALKPPAQQNAFGLGGELQLTFPHLAIAGGYTPFEFLVSTFTARFQWRPGNGPVTLSFEREPVRDSQLSYAGLRDPGQASLTYPGQVWGGVIANQGLVQFSRGDAQSGFYFAAGGQYLTGVSVEKNSRIDGTGGAYWRAFTSPEYGDLTIGANFFGMHYANNQNAFTHGMGGYFSPQAYFLGNIPVSWVGHYQTHWHYNITGAVGAQAFQEDSTPLWPLAGDKPLQTSQNNPMLPAVTSVSANYDFHSQVACQISPHWFAGAYLAANNTRDYSYASAGFFIRFMFRAQPSAATAPTGLFPADGVRPFTVP